MQYPEGWFTQPCRRWWRDWRPLLEMDAADVREAHGRAQGQRVRAQRLGFGRANGTIALPQTPAWQAPSDMKGGRG